MTNDADPWAPPMLPALSRRVALRTSIERIGGPERIYDTTAADPDWEPTPVGFAPPAAAQPRPPLPLTTTYDPDALRQELGLPVEPLVWEGDGA